MAFDNKVAPFAVLASFIVFAVVGCTSTETAQQVAQPVEGSDSAALLDIVGDTPVEHLPVPAPDVVGALAGDASVQGGAAAYVIAIEVPPGRRGVQPRISLRYDSRAGNGIAGVGWSLSAESSIYRCPRTIAMTARRAAWISATRTGYALTASA
jgi:hypothetical protein